MHCTLNLPARARARAHQLLLHFHGACSKTLPGDGARSSRGPPPDSENTRRGAYFAPIPRLHSPALNGPFGKTSAPIGPVLVQFGAKRTCPFIRLYRRTETCQRKDHPYHHWSKLEPKWLRTTRLTTLDHYWPPPGPVVCRRWFPNQRRGKKTSPSFSPPPSSPALLTT